MRILHVVSRSQRRGAECAALELAEELEALGHENRVVSLAQRLDGNEDPALPALVASTSLSWWSRPAIAWRLRRRIDRDHPDVVVAHGGSAAQVAVVAKPRHGTVVWQQIGPFPPKIAKQPRRAFWWAVTRRIDGAIALTRGAAAEIRKLGYHGPVCAIPNFRRPQRFAAVDRARAGRELRNALGVASSTRLVGFVGYLGEPKCPERALEVIAELRRSGVDAHLVIAGEGPQRAALERSIMEMNLDGSVTLLGHRDDIEHVLAGVDVAILTSDYEGMPGVAIEAAMAGCPFVTFPLGDVGEIVESGTTGIILERPDITSMVESVGDLLRDDQRRMCMSIEARRRSDRFSVHACAQMYVEMFSRCRAASR